jgi:hypothetical protein
MKLIKLLLAFFIAIDVYAGGAAIATALAQPATQPTAAPATQPAAHGWPDRRPISVLMLADTGYRTAKNPRGWNPAFYGDLDVADPAYAVEFNRRSTAFYRDKCLPRAKKQGAQIILAWDIEGQEKEHANSYGGDPSDGTTDITQEQIRYWVWLAAQEGINFGFTFRDSVNVRGTQAKAWDPAANLADKINKARRLYGPTVRAAYYDSNGNPDPTSDLWAIEDFQIARVRKAIGPDVLLIPEFNGPGYGNIDAVAPIRHWPDPAAPAESAGFEVIQTVPDPKLNALGRQSLTNALAGGAIPLMCATWDQQSNAVFERAMRKTNN